MPSVCESRRSGRSARTPVLLLHPFHPHLHPHPPLAGVAETLQHFGAVSIGCSIVDPTHDPAHHALILVLFTSAPETAAQVYDERWVLNNKGIQLHPMSDRRTGCFTGVIHVLKTKGIQFHKGSDSGAV